MLLSRQLRVNELSCTPRIKTVSQIPSISYYKRYVQAQVHIYTQYLRLNSAALIPNSSLPDA